MQTGTGVSRHMPSPQCSQINASLALRPYPAHVGCSCCCFLRKWIWVLAYRQFPKFLPRDLATAGIIICHNLLRDGSKVQQRQNTKRSAPYPRLLLSIPLYSTHPTFSLSPRIPGWLLFLFFFLSSTLPTSLASPLLQVPIINLEKFASLTPALSHSVISLGGHFGMGLPCTPLTLHATELYFIMLVPKDLGSSPGACASHGPNSHTRTLRPTQCHLQQLHFMAHRSLVTPSTNNKFFRFLPLTVPLLY